jgi:hypothetical protein
VGLCHLVVTGSGVGAAYVVTVNDSPPRPEWIHVVFEDVRIGDGGTEPYPL